MNIEEIFLVLNKHKISFSCKISNSNVNINNAKALSFVESNSLGFSDHILEGEETTVIKRDNLLVLSNENLSIVLSDGNYIFTDLPKLSFIYLLEQLHLDPDFILSLPKKKIGRNVTIEKNTFIGDCVEVGDNVLIGPNCSIGTVGIGYVKERDGSLVQFPHIGKVIIEDNVEIQSNVCIVRGSLLNTVIRKNCKINNLVNIGHNTEIGENSVVAAGTIICGSTKVGKNCFIAPNCSIVDRIVIADNTFIGIGSVVPRSILEPGGTWFGIPAKRRN